MTGSYKRGGGPRSSLSLSGSNDWDMPVLLDDQKERATVHRSRADKTSNTAKLNGHTGERYFLKCVVTYKINASKGKPIKVLC